MSLKENDIRPSDLDEGKLKALKEDLERLYSKQDNLQFKQNNCDTQYGEAKLSPLNEGRTGGTVSLPQTVQTWSA